MLHFDFFVLHAESPIAYFFEQRCRAGYWQRCRGTFDTLGFANATDGPFGDSVTGTIQKFKDTLFVDFFLEVNIKGILGMLLAAREAIRAMPDKLNIHSIGSGLSNSPP